MNDAVNRLFDAYHMEDAGMGIGFGPTILTKYAKYLSINYTPEESRAIFTWIGSYQVLKKAEKFNMPNLKPSPDSPFSEKHYESFFNEWLMIRQNDSLTEEQKKDYYETLFDSYRLSEPESEGDMNLFMKFIALRGDGYANEFVNQFTKYTVRKGFSSALNFFGLSKHKSTPPPPPPPPPSSNESNTFFQNSSAEESSKINESQSSKSTSQEISLSDEAISSLLKEVKSIYSNTASKEDQDKEVTLLISHLGPLNITKLQGAIMKDDVDEKMKLETLFRLNKVVVSVMNQSHTDTTQQPKDHSHSQAKSNTFTSNTSQSTGNQNSKNSQSKNEANKKSSKKESADKNAFIIELSPITLLAIFAVPFVFFFFFNREGLKKELTFQDFERDFLRRKLVSKLIVVNDSSVLVGLNEAGVSQALQEHVLEYFFTIGSVKKFEEKLKKAQEEAGIPEESRVPVIYSHPTPVMQVQEIQC
ncbi:unnamed protein product [Ambrosiozyma monospora]|uniref:Unnamed protein product n=1 Tax=Ambrosiozyma monospora TaxID=43982 RepID=A0A9W6Z7G1_AMBMO|nr:unnamed protein product [Ambrosiozyma monospora]